MTDSERNFSGGNADSSADGQRPSAEPETYEQPGDFIYPTTPDSPYSGLSSSAPLTPTPLTPSPFGQPSPEQSPYGQSGVAQSPDSSSPYAPAAPAAAAVPNPPAGYETPTYGPASPATGVVPYGTPGYGTPGYGTPGYGAGPAGNGTPGYGAAPYGSPGYGATPGYSAAGYGAPVYGAAAPGYGMAPGYGVPAYYAQPPQPKGLSITSLSLGCASIFFGFFLPIPLAAVICGIVGLRREPSGKAMSIIGLCLGSLVFLFWSVYIIAIIMVVVGASTSYRY